MTEIIKLAQEKKIDIYIKPMDGSFRPLIGKLNAIVQLSNDENCITINILDSMSESSIELAIDDAIRRLTYS